MQNTEGKPTGIRKEN